MPEGQKKPLHKGRIPPQELEVGPRSRPYLLVSVTSRSAKSRYTLLTDVFLTNSYWVHKNNFTTNTWNIFWLDQSKLSRRGELDHEFRCTWVKTAKCTVSIQMAQWKDSSTLNWLERDRNFFNVSLWASLTVSLLFTGSVDSVYK